MEKLQLCPWCAASGSSGDLLVLPSIRAWKAQVVCNRCGARGPEAKTVEKAVVVWNDAERIPHAPLTSQRKASHETHAND